MGVTARPIFPVESPSVLLCKTLIPKARTVRTSYHGPQELRRGPSDSQLVPDSGATGTGRGFDGRDGDCRRRRPLEGRGPYTSQDSPCPRLRHKT